MRFSRGFGGGGFGGLDENAWAESVAQNLEKILARMDERESEYRTIRDDVKLFLDGFRPDENDKTKLVRVQPNDPVNYGLVLDIVEGFYPAVTSPWWQLIDLISNRVNLINTILAQETLDERLRKRLLVKLREWLGYGVYEVQKITITEIEKRETRLRESTIGILSRDAAPLLGKGDVGRETKRYIRTESENRDFEEEDEDDFDDDEDEEDSI